MNPPPGWYPDPDGTYMQRFWDGQRWTDLRAPGRKPLPWWLVTAGVLCAVFVILVVFF